MNITIAIDSFKGSLSTFMAAEAVSEGIGRVYKNANISIFPMADGGEGTVNAIVKARGGSFKGVKVKNPLGKEIEGIYGIVEDTAIIEMAAAAGITLIDEKERNPLNTTTYGVGEMILDAMNSGCRKFIIGIGGSATNDGGVGMLQALGFGFYDASGKEIEFGAKGLEKLADIKCEGKDKRLDECEFHVACDVKNVLCGENGCSAVYGPQKGATGNMIADMDKWLLKYALLSKKVNPEADPDREGSGAAGGMGFAFLSYLKGSLESGVGLVIKETGLEESVKSADFVVTGEGRLDGQSYMGKAPVGVAECAKKYRKPVIAFSGCVTRDAGECNNHGIDAFFPVLRNISTLEEAMDIENAFRNVSDTAEQVFRLIKISEKKRILRRKI